MSPVVSEQQTRSDQSAQESGNRPLLQQRTAKHGLHTACACLPATLHLARGAHLLLAEHVGCVGGRPFQNGGLSELHKLQQG